MRKLIRIIIVAIAGLLLVGVPNLWNYLRYRQPVAITDSRTEPFSLPSYVLLQGIQLRATEALRTDSRRGARILVPVRFRDDPEGSRITVVLESDDPALMEAITRLGGKQSAAKEVMVLETFAGKTEAVGMVKSSIGEKELQAELRRRIPALVENFAIVREGESPSLGLAVLALSLAAALGALLFWIRSRERAADAAPPPFIPAPAEPPPLPAQTPASASTQNDVMRELEALSQRAREPVGTAAKPARAASPPTPLPGKAPSAGFKQEILRELEAVDREAKDDYVTVGIGLIRTGAPELLTGWLRAFAKADIYVVSIELNNPQAAFIFGPEGDRNYIAAFTRINLAMQCLREMPQLKFTLKLKGSDLLQLAKANRRGLWLNPLNEACSVKFPPVMMARFIKETGSAG